MKQLLIAVTAGLTLSACAEYDYVYDYDPYLGPHGHYVAHVEHPIRSALSCAAIADTGPYNAGDYRGPYVSGPSCGPAVAEAARAR